MLPDSPRFLASVGRNKEAREVLVGLRGTDDDQTDDRQDRCAAMLLLAVCPVRRREQTDRDTVDHGVEQPDPSLFAVEQREVRPARECGRRCRGQADSEESTRRRAIA